MTNRYPQTAAHRPAVRRGKTASDKKDGSGSKMALRFATCILAVAAAFAFKYTFPAEARAFSDTADRYLYGNVDYRSALSVIGKAVAGEEDAFTALPQAWTYAFGIQTDDSTDAIQTVNQEDIEEIPEAKIIIDDTEPEQTSAEPEKTDEEVKTDAEAEEDEAVIAFLKKQEQFSGIELPENVSYEKPAIDFEYDLPVSGTVSSSFGYRVHPVEDRVLFHYGTDIAASEGTDILSFADGTVYAVGESTGYGNYIIVQHGNGIKTQYSHCSKITASQGAEIKKGDCIAKVGSTGNATSSCLHFEIIVDGVYVNPEFYLKWN